MNTAAEMVLIVQDAAARLDRFEACLGTTAIDAVQQEGSLAALATPPDGPRAVLARLFGLGTAEQALLDLCLAVAIEPALETRIADLQGQPWRPLPTEALVRALHDLAPGAIWRPTSPLARWLLVERMGDPSGAAPTFRADPRIVDWIAGKAALDEGLSGICRPPASAPATPAWDLADASVGLAAMIAESDSPICLHMIGPRDSGRAELAAQIARRHNLEALEIEGAAMPGGRVDELYTRVQRFALLTGRMPIWRSLPEKWPGHLDQAPLQAIVLPDRQSAPRHAARSFEVRQPELGAQDRRSIWQSLVGSQLPLALARSSLGELRAMAQLARSPGAVEAAIRDRALADLGEIGRVIVPRLSWDDLVLPNVLHEALDEFVDEAREQAERMADPAFRRLFAKDAAPTALFSGPPGVGKTMAAECVAGELGLPLLAIDVARTVSKYIGETAKNLSRIFDEAHRYGCVLFFDEADAYFSRRTEVKDSQDRHANADTGHLLQLIEDYEGIVILGTNKRGQIDEAFIRRIRHAIEFPKPARPERLRLWRNLAGHLFASEEVHGAAEALGLCAERFELTPAQIKAAILTASYRARREQRTLGLSVLIPAVARELRKEGRSLPADLVLLVDRQEEMEEVRRVA